MLCRAGSDRKGVNCGMPTTVTMPLSARSDRNVSLLCQDHGVADATRPIGNRKGIYFYMPFRFSGFGKLKELQFR